MASTEFDPTTTFGPYLRFLRRRARLTQTELGIAVGYSPGQISMIENGQRQPDPTAVAALFIAALGLETDKQASTQLVKLAQNAPAQQIRHKDDSVRLNNEPTPSAQRTTLIVEQHIIYQHEELGLLEDIPPQPVYLVARPEPLQRLQQWFQRERCVAICGLAGMGKSTLAATYAHSYERHHPVCWITLSPGVNGAPEAMLRQLALFVAAYAADPTRVTPFFRQPAAQEPDIPFQHQLMLIAAGLGELDAPLLVFDDAHHIADDEQMLQALQRLQHLAPACRLLLITRSELNLPGVLHLTLAGLAHTEARTLVDQLGWSLESVAEQTVDELLTRTAGSPMLIRLAISQLEQQAPIQLAAVGASLATYLVETVLTQLDPAARQALAFLSIWRGVVDLTDPQLAELLGEELSGYEHAKAIASLQRRRLIDHVAHATPHRLLREPVLTTLNAQPTQRRLLHQVAAKWAGLRGDWVEAAHHYGCAGDLQSACDVITNQGAAPLQLGQSVVAAAVVEEILTLARRRASVATTHTADAAHAAIRQLLILHGDLLANTLRASEAHASYRAAMALTTQPLARAELADRLALSLFRRGSVQDALALCEQALALLATNFSADGVRMRVQIERTRIRALLALSRFEEARQICQRALDLVKPVALLMPGLADYVRAYALLVLGYIPRFQGRNQEARQQLLKCVKHARAANLREVEADALIYLSAAQRDLGDFAGAEANARQALIVAQANENEFQAANILHFMSVISYYQDDLASAHTRSQQAMALKQRMGDSTGMVACEIVQALILAAENQLDAAWRLVQHALTDSELLESTWLHGLALYVAGVVLTYQGAAPLAETRLHEALTCDGFYQDQSLRTGAQTFLGIAYVAQGKLDQAAQVVAAPVAPGTGIDIELMRGLVQGMLHLARGEAEGVHTVAHQTAQRARETGYLLYAVEAERLARLIDNPPLLSQLPRAVCCRGQGHS